METRFHYIDNLRTGALLLGVIFHASLAYGPFYYQLWLTADPHNHASFDYITHFLHLFRMPLFFVIAGLCAALILAKRGRRAFIVHRSKRILLPFLVGLPVIGGLYFHALTWGVSVASFTPPIFSALREVETQPISTMHLWFLWYLMQFSVVIWGISYIPKFYQMLINSIARPWSLAVVGPTLICLALYTQPMPFPAPDKLLPALWVYGFYGLFFLLGASIYHHGQLLVKGYQYRWYLVGAGVISFVAYCAVLPPAITQEAILQAVRSGELAKEADGYFIKVMIQSVAVITWTAVVLVFGHRYLNKSNLVSRYLSDSSYWVYFIHVPVLVYIQMPMISFTNLPLVFKFILSVLGTLAVSIVTYHLLVRHTWIGRVLNGVRLKQGEELGSREVSIESAKK